MSKIRLNLLILSDAAVMSVMGLLLPILPIFLINNIKDANIQNITFSYSLYFISAVIFYWIKTSFLKHGNEWLRKYSGLIAGSLIISAAPLGYIISINIEHIFLVQLVFGMGVGFYKSSWNSAIKEIIKPTNQTFKKLHQLVTMLALAIAAATGGYIAYFSNFPAVFATMIYLGFIATIINIVLLLSFYSKKG